MARHKKRGIEYFSLDCNFFSNRKIKILKSRYGADGITIFIYLLCEIYKNGYYIIVDDDFYYIMSDDLNMNSDKVKQVLTFLLERSMFDKQLFQSDAVLTSAGIQERFQLAVKTRAKKNPIKVDRFWLLNEEETEPFIKVTHFEDNSENNTDNSKKNNDNSREESLKESKVKESKVNKSKEKNIYCTEPEKPPSAPSVITLPLNDKTYYGITQVEVDHWNELYPAVDIMAELRKMKGWCEGNPAKRKTRRGIVRFVNTWLAKEQDRGGSRKASQSPVNRFLEETT